MSEDMTYEPVFRHSAQDERFAAQDKRISILELQVHRMLNPEPISDEWLEASEYLKGYTDGRASVTRTEGDYVHVPGAIWEALKEELETLRATRQTYHCQCGWFGRRMHSNIWLEHTALSARTAGT